MRVTKNLWGGKMLDEIEDKLKRLESIEMAIKAFKIGYGCTVSEQKEMIKAEVEGFFDIISEIYLEG